MPLALAWVLLGLHLTAAHRTFLLVQGSQTPSEVLSLIQDQVALAWLPAGFHISQVEISHFPALEVLIPDSIGVIDLTFSSVEQRMLAGLCDVSEIPHMVLGYVSDIHSSEWTYYVSGRESDLAAALDAVVSYFGWAKVNVAIQEHTPLIRVGKILEQQITPTYETQDFTLNSPLNVDNTVGKGMRMSGNRVSVLLTEPSTTQSIVTAQYYKNIGGVGFGNLMPVYSSLYALSYTVPSQVTGNLVLAESELAGVETLSELYTY